MWGCRAKLGYVTSDQASAVGLRTEMAAMVAAVRGADLIGIRHTGEGKGDRIIARKEEGWKAGACIHRQMDQG